MEGKAYLSQYRYPQYGNMRYSIHNQDDEVDYDEDDDEVDKEEEEEDDEILLMTHHKSFYF